MQCSIWASDVMLRSPAGYLMGDPSWRRQEPLPRLLSAFHRWQKQALDLGWDDVALLLFVQTSDEWAQVFSGVGRQCQNAVATCQKANWGRFPSLKWFNISRQRGCQRHAWLLVASPNSSPYAAISVSPPFRIAGCLPSEQFSRFWVMVYSVWPQAHEAMSGPWCLTG